MNATPRTKEPVDVSTPPEPLPRDMSAVLVRGARIPLTVTVLRTVGPFVHLNICGELIQILRSRLEKELSNGC